MGTVAIKPTKPLILASKSEARDKILQKSGILFSIKPSNVNESEIKKRVQDAAKILMLTDYLKRLPKELSGGQRQRVALGRAIVRQPQVFLFDEPLSNLDAKLRSEMRLEIKKLHQMMGTTMVYVTHDQTEAMTMGDRIAVMNNGIIEQLETPRNLYDHPCLLYTSPSPRDLSTSRMPSSA